MEIELINALVIGLGVSGKAAAKFLLNQKANVLAADKNFEQLHSDPCIIDLLNSGLKLQSDAILVDWQAINLIVLSPGISQNHPLILQAKAYGIKVINEIELGFRFRKNPVIGITGTNGKTTVTSLVTHVLNENGIKAHALGNIGQALTSKILEINQSDTIVLELSSFQLETLSEQFLDHAVILNITADHLDRYAGMEDYAAAKFKIQSVLKEGKKLILNGEIYSSFGHHVDQNRVKTYGYNQIDVYHTDLHSVYYRGIKEFELPDEYKKKCHDLENLIAAYALCADHGITALQFLGSLNTFKKPPHRIEFVCEHEGVNYYDDSKGTNLDAVIRAVEGFNEQIYLIAGGIHKGASYLPWIKTFAGKVKKIYAIGQAASKIKDELDSEIIVEIMPNLEEAVIAASKIAKKGEVVLLSPGCSSYDMFKDYAHRGKVFQEAVYKIKGEVQG